YQRAAISAGGCICFTDTRTGTVSVPPTAATRFPEPFQSTACGSHTPSLPRRNLWLVAFRVGHVQFYRAALLPTFVFPCRSRHWPCASRPRVGRVHIVCRMG